MKEQSTKGSDKAPSNPVEAQGRRVHHGIEDGKIDIKGKFRNWPNAGGKK